MAPYVELKSIGMNLKPQIRKNEVKEMFDPHFERTRRNAPTRILRDAQFFDQPQRIVMSKPIREPMEDIRVNQQCFACQYHKERIAFYEKILTIVVIGLMAKLLLDSVCSSKKKSGIFS